MKIENEQLDIESLSIDQIKMSGHLIGIHNNKKLHLSSSQIKMLEMMYNGHSIASMVREEMKKGKLLPFNELLNLLNFLLSEKLIKNKSFYAAFRNIEQSKPQAPDFFESLSQKIFGSEENIDVAAEAKKTPFLRNIDPAILDAFLRNSKLVEATEGVQICQTGQIQRSLFVMLRGQASVYKKHQLNNSMQKIATLRDHAVFGEVGFFLGEPRSADIVTDTDCLVLRIKYIPELYDNLIKSEKAKELQKRFWLIHSLLKSATFRELPEDSFDALIFAGQVKSFSPNTVICREGEQGRSCFIIVQGNVAVSKEGRSIRILSQGDLFGEVALMMTGGKRSASVQAQSEVLALEIDSTKFYDLLAENLWLACEFERVALQRLRAQMSAES